MKKILSVLIIMSLMVMSLGSIAMADSSSIVVHDVESTPVNTNVIYKFIDPSLKTDPIALEKFPSLMMSSVASEQYLYSYYKIRDHRIVGYNSLPTYNQKHIISIAKGQTVSTTRTVSTSGSVSFESSPSTEIKGLINSSFGISGSVTYEVTNGTTFSFPSEWTAYNSADFYLGVSADKHKFTLDKVDVYQVSVGNYGFTLEHRTDSNGSKTQYAHKPKKVVYSKPGSH